MNEIETINVDEFNKIEIHYWLQDKSHLMDALVENRCSYEIIGIIRELAKVYDLDIAIETEALGEGGIKRWLKIISKSENKKATISTTVITALISVILITPLSKVSEKLIDKIFEDTELNELQKEKLRQEIEQIEIDNSIKLLKNPTIRKKKSNLYETLEKYPKVEEISFDIQGNNKEFYNKEKFVERKEFKNFILVSDELEPIKIENANIEIISPVLKKGKYKWSGYYEGEVVFFTMKSTEFKNLVQTGKIEFKNGSSINCGLLIKKKVDNEGIIKTSGYEVFRVNYYFENDKPIETREGKKYKNKKQDNSRQMDLFSDTKFED